MTQDDFLLKYAELLPKYYHWANDEKRLEEFIEKVRETLAGRNTWSTTGAVVLASWVACGGVVKHGKFSLRKLRALPTISTQ